MSNDVDSVGTRRAEPVNAGVGTGGVVNAQPEVEPRPEVDVVVAVRRDRLPVSVAGRVKRRNVY